MRILLLVLWSVAATAGDALQAERVREYFRETARGIVSVTPDLPNAVVRFAEGGTIEVLDADLRDNTGSLVDALGVPGKVTLSQQRWISFLREGRDVRLLVLHELFRMAGLDDDDYVLSRRHAPVAIAVARGYCDLRIATTKLQPLSRDMRAFGFDRPPEAGILIMGAGQQNVAMDAAVDDLRERCEAAGFTHYRVGSAGMSMVRRNTNGFTRMETRVDIQGSCHGERAVQRSRNDQRADACRKARLCEGLVRDGVVARLEAADETELQNLRTQWRCQ